MKSVVTVGWFEIPVVELKRAKKFYESVFNTRLTTENMGGITMSFFPWSDDMKGAGGALVDAGEHYTPSHDGTLVYFSSEDVNTELSRVEKAGGKVLQKRTEISPEIGFMALFEDTEGNRLALHSRK